MIHFSRRRHAREHSARRFRRPWPERLEPRTLLAVGTIELGPSDNIALDQPRVAVELLLDTDPSPGEQWETVGPNTFNTFLLDTGANSVLAMATAVSDMTPGRYATQGEFVEQGVAGEHPMDISIPYRFDFAGTSGIRHTLDDASILSDPDNDFSMFGPWGLVGMPAMVNRVTSLDMTGWSGGGLGLDDLYMKTDFGDEVPAEIAPVGESHRYAVPVDNRLAFDPLDQVVYGAPPVWGDVPFLTAVPTHNGVGQAGNFLFDTGAQISVISARLALDIGLDSNGDGQLNELDDAFVTTETVGGVGGQVTVPVFAIDEVHLPATRVASGAEVELVWTDLQWLVLDIPTPAGQPSLDGVFGSDLITGGWFSAFFSPGSPDGYIDRIHFDFRDMDHGAGTLYFDLNVGVDQVTVPGPGVRIRQTARSTDVGEGGETDTYTIALQTVPAAPVEITVTADDQTQLSADGTTFTPALKLTFTDTAPQTIAVQAVDDEDAEGPHTSILTHVVASLDGDYNQLSIPDITVHVTDNDLRLITITSDEAGLHGMDGMEIAEGQKATYWVALNNPPGAGETTYVQFEDHAAQVSPINRDGGPWDPTDAVAFTDANWNQPQAVEVTATDDSMAEGPHQALIVHTVLKLDELFELVVLGQSTFPVHITDNDLGGATIAETNGSTHVAEAGATDTYQIALNTVPTGPVQVTVTAGAQTEVSLDGTTFAPTLVLTFTDTAPQWLAVRAVDDDVHEGAHAGTISHAVTGTIHDPAYPATLSIADVTATITDNDSAGLTISQTGGATQVTEGGAADTYTVALTSQPTDDVRVFLNHTAGQITAVDNAHPANAFVTFTPADWSTPQHVRVTAVDDELVEGPQTAVISHAAFSTDPNYQGNVLLTVAVTDDDADQDGDGVPKAVEDAAPHDGDGNNDGTPDSQQDNVASLPNLVDSSYVTLALPAGARLDGVAASEHPSPADVPPGLTFPVGFYEYTIADVGIGLSTELTIYWEAGATVNSYWQFGPTPDGPTPHWYPFLYDGTTGAEIFPDRIEIHYVDGLRGDHDLTANGQIADPGAPGTQVHPWQNPLQPENVNNDSLVSALDALTVINRINAKGTGPLPPVPPTGESLPPFWDVSGDDRIEAVDVLLIVNYLNKLAAANTFAAGGEGETALGKPGLPPGARADDPKLGLLELQTVRPRCSEMPLRSATVDCFFGLRTSRQDERSASTPWPAVAGCSDAEPKRTETRKADEKPAADFVPNVEPAWDAVFAELGGMH